MEGGRAEAHDAVDPDRQIRTALDLLRATVDASGMKYRSTCAAGMRRCKCAGKGQRAHPARAARAGERANPDSFAAANDVRVWRRRGPKGRCRAIRTPTMPTPSTLRR